MALICHRSPPWDTYPIIMNTPKTPAIREDWVSPLNISRPHKFGAILYPVCTYTCSIELFYGLIQNYGMFFFFLKRF
ncbi:hypothetical protein GDO81_009197 [Engystomops pustulosus]|uniref:Uncharacterized protein n=1 Tax=Engystomops pustulosus TaxID=76066 RepID=A0AAV7BPU0_ENGPU|nr:hypothetical protein GDO81_009197 [Engystomops pustulosus]